MPPVDAIRRSIGPLRTHRVPRKARPGQVQAGRCMRTPPSGVPRADRAPQAQAPGLARWGERPTKSELAFVRGTRGRPDGASRPQALRPRCFFASALAGPDLNGRLRSFSRRGPARAVAAGRIERGAKPHCGTFAMGPVPWRDLRIWGTMMLRMLTPQKKTRKKTA